MTVQTQLIEENVNHKCYFSESHPIDPLETIDRPVGYDYKKTTCDNVLFL